MQNFPADKSKYKLIISDFDGTLAGVDHIVTSKVIEAVKRWQDSGKLLTIATGRQYSMVEDECKKLGIVTPVIVRGGSEIVDPTTGEYIHQELIDENIVSEILDFLSKNNLRFLVSVDNYIYSTYDYPYKFPKVIEKPYKEFVLQAVPKIVVKAFDGGIARTSELLEKFETEHPQLSVFKTHNHSGYGWDITSVKASKLHGVLELLKTVDLSRDEIIGVGDSYNDFPLLEAAGLKVAMENGHQELKEIADIVIPSYKDDGVAFLIDSLLA